jgi:hypothetical protein
VRSINPEKGTALLELAVLLPLLLLLAMILMEGGAMIRTHIVINNAAREGARFAAQINHMQQADVQQVVSSYAQMNGVTVAPGEVSFIAEDSLPGPNGLFMEASRVTIQHPYTFNYLPAWGIAATRQLYGRAEFRNLHF